MFISKKSPEKFELEALRQSQAVIYFKPDGTVTDANQKFLDALGYTLDEVKGRHHSIFLDPQECLSPEYKEFWATLAKGKYTARQFKRRTKRGQDIWIEASYNPVSGEDGKVIYVVKYAVDVTDQKLRLADYEGQLSAIGKSQAVIEFNLDGSVITANHNFLTTLDYALDDIAGRHHSMFVEPAYAKRPEYQAFWQKLERGEFVSGEFQRFGRNGKEVWIQASYNPIFDMNGKPFKVVKYATDITAEKLKNADVAGQIAAISKAQAVIEFNLDGTVITANDNFLKTLGYTLDEIKGRHHRMFVAPLEAQRPEYDAFWDSLRRGQFDARVYKRIAKDGREVWIQASYNPIFDMNGKPTKVIKYATDVTQVIQVGGIADQATASTQTVAAAVEEMSASIAEISKNMALTSSATGGISDATRQAGTAADQLLDATKSMENIIRMIEEIAGQTNLLALNATIEAARAGEAGKGFAVVANEVKSLASQTAKATEEVAREIKNVQLASRALSENIGDISQSAGTVNSYVSSVAGAIEEQSSVTKEISSNTNQMAYLVEDITQRIKRLTTA